MNVPDWRKSSISAAYNGCVEAAVATWRKSGHSGSNGHCAEVTLLPAGPWPPNVATAVERKLAQLGEGGKR